MCVLIIRFLLSGFQKDLKKEIYGQASLQIIKSMNRPLKGTHLRACTGLFHNEINRREMWVPKAGTHSSASLRRACSHGQGTHRLDNRWTSTVLFNYIFRTGNPQLQQITFCFCCVLFLNSMHGDHWKWKPPKPYLGKTKCSSSLLFTVRYMDLLTSAPTSLLTLHR